MTRAWFVLCCALLTACASSNDPSPAPVNGMEPGNPPTSMTGAQPSAALGDTETGAQPPTALGGTETGNPPSRMNCDPKFVCTPCPPPITLVLTDATHGGPIAGVSVDGDAEVCISGAEATVCTLQSKPYSALGLHELLIEAPGYEATPLEIELLQNPRWACCPCAYSAVHKELTLVPRSP
jgi:hypothetical protein